MAMIEKIGLLIVKCSCNKGVNMKHICRYWRPMEGLVRSHCARKGKNAQCVSATSFEILEVA